MKKYSIWALSLFTAEAVVRILGFVATVYLARILQTSGFGLITIGGSYCAYALLVSDLGTKTLGFIQASKPEGSRQFDLRNIIHTRIFLALFACAIFFPLSFLMYPDTDIRLVCILYLLTVFYDVLFLDWLFKGMQQFNTVSAARVLGSAAYVTGLIVFVKTPSDFLKVPLLFFIANLCSIIPLVPKIPRSLMSLSFSFSNCKSIIIHSSYLGMGSLLTQVTAYLPPLVIGTFKPVHESGTYGAAIRIVLLFLIIDTVVTPLYISTLPRWWEKDKEAARQLLQKIMTVLIVLCASISFFTAIMAKPLIHFVFGDQYIESVPLLQITIWFGALTVLNTLISYGVIIIGDKKRYLNASVRGFLFGSFIITVLTLFLGNGGASIGIVASELVFILIFQEEFKKYCHLPVYSKIIRTFCAVVAAYGAVFIIPLPLSLLCQAIIGNTIFYTIVFATKTLTLNDISFVLHLWKQR